MRKWQKYGLIAILIHGLLYYGIYGYLYSSDLSSRGWMYSCILFAIIEIPWILPMGILGADQIMNTGSTQLNAAIVMPLLGSIFYGGWFAWIGRLRDKGKTITIPLALSVALILFILIGLTKFILPNVN